MLTSNVIDLFCTNLIEFPLKERPLESYYDLTEEKLVRITLAVHSIKSACRQEVCDLLSS